TEAKPAHFRTACAQESEERCSMEAPARVGAQVTVSSLAQGGQAEGATPSAIPEPITICSCRAVPGAVLVVSASYLVHPTAPAAARRMHHVPEWSGRRPFPFPSSRPSSALPTTPGA